MNKRIVWTIAKKDIRGIFSNKQILIPMLIVPFVLCGLLPAIVILLGTTLDLSMINGIGALKSMIANLPEGELRETLARMPEERDQIIYMFVNFMLLPLFLLIPVLSSSMIAANSFVGEKERKTLESLLFAPIEIKDLFVGKVLSAFIPTLIISLGSFVLCGLVVDGLTYTRFDQLIFPNLSWIILILWIVPILSIFAILFNVLISARVKGFQEAQQMGGIIVLPLLALMISQVSGLFLINPLILIGLGAVVLVFNVFLLNRITKMNDRQTLFEKQIH